MNRRDLLKAAGIALAACVPATVLAKPKQQSVKAPVEQEPPPVFTPPKGKSWWRRPQYQIAEELNRQAYRGRTDWWFNANSTTHCMVSFETYGPASEKHAYPLVVGGAELDQLLHQWDKEQGNDAYTR